jgi:hypothetical protein
MLCGFNLDVAPTAAASRRVRQNLDFLFTAAPKHPSAL